MTADATPALSLLERVRLSVSEVTYAQEHDAVIVPDEDYRAYMQEIADALAGAERRAQHELTGLLDDLQRAEVASRGDPPAARAYAQAQQLVTRRLDALDRAAPHAPATAETGEPPMPKPAPALAAARAAQLLCQHGYGASLSPTLATYVAITQAGEDFLLAWDEATTLAALPGPHPLSLAAHRNANGGFSHWQVHHQPAEQVVTTAADALRLLAAWLESENSSDRGKTLEADQTASALLDRIFAELTPDGLKAQAVAVDRARIAIDAAIQCETDLLDVYRRGASMVTLDEAVGDLKRDSLPSLKAARAGLTGAQEAPR